MSDVTIYGAPQSTYVRTARMACEEKGVPHQLGAIEFGSPAHLELHPFAKMPAMRHGQVHLFETIAICRYIDTNFDGPSLQPGHSGQLGIMDQWISAIDCYMYDTLIKKYVLQYVFPKGPDGQPDRSAIDEGLPEVERQIGLIDTALEGNTYLAGDQLSLADLFVAPIMSYLGNLPESGEILAKSANIQRAGTAMKERPSFINTMPPPPADG